MKVSFRFWGRRASLKTNNLLVLTLTLTNTSAKTVSENPSSVRQTQAEASGCFKNLDVGEQSPYTSTAVGTIHWNL